MSNTIPAGKEAAWGAWREKAVSLLSDKCSMSPNGELAKHFLLKGIMRAVDEKFNDGPKKIAAMKEYEDSNLPEALMLGRAKFLQSPEAAALSGLNRMIEAEKNETIKNLLIAQRIALLAILNPPVEETTEEPVVTE